MKLALGTAQFGLDYGISNPQGQVSPLEVKQILRLASEVGITTLDCAAAYGNSEAILGALPQSQHFDIVTKIPPLPDTELSIIPYFNNSIKHLKRTKIDTLLFHDVNTILQHPHSELFCHEIKQLKAEKKVKRIGISVYTPEHIEQSLEKLSIDVVQAPLNVFDQRVCHQATVKLLNQHNIKLHARSVFLQGLLLMATDTWPEYFTPYLGLLGKFDALASRLQLSKLTLALAFLLQNVHIKPYLEQLVVGCCSQSQLQQIVQSYNQAVAYPLEQLNWHEFACHEQALINPSFW